jgi:hypothetical protein
MRQSPPFPGNLNLPESCHNTDVWKGDRCLKRPAALHPIGYSLQKMQ